MLAGSAKPSLPVKDPLPSVALTPRPKALLSPRTATLSGERARSKGERNSATGDGDEAAWFVRTRRRKPCAVVTFKKIVVAADFSANADRALALATELARREQGELHLMQAWRIGSYALPPPLDLVSPTPAVTTFEHIEDALKVRGLMPSPPPSPITKEEEAHIRATLAFLHAKIADPNGRLTHAHDG